MNVRQKLLSLFFLLGVLTLSQGKLHAQNPQPVPPDCVIFINNWTTAQSSAAFPNYFTGCQSWTLQYTSIGFTGLTLTFQSAPAATATTPSTFVTYAGTVSTGINPNTSLTGAVSTFANGTVDIPYTRVTLSNLTGSGTVFGVVYGYKTGFTGGGGGGGSGGGCVGTVGTPCIVAQATASQLNAQIQGPGTAGAALTGNPVLGGVSDGTNVQNTYSCTNQAAVSIAAGTDVTIITATAAKTIRLCHLDFSSDTTADMTIRQGTGTTCGTSTVALTGAYKNILGIAEDYTALAPLVTTVAARDICLHFSTNVTAGGFVVYAVF